MHVVSVDPSSFGSRHSAQLTGYHQKNIVIGGNIASVKSEYDIALGRIVRGTAASEHWQKEEALPAVLR